ncbi:MAG: hypothetical protein HGJ93_00555 [Desulfosarcina sp.]|nr:hypothetical protein [Desulfosarcina sp.]MBC2764476.1 hypothetical protein [Desulfosarcina sp.]
MQQIIIKIVAIVIVCSFLLGIGYFAVKRIWGNRIDPLAWIISLLKAPSEKIPVVADPINIEPSIFHLKNGVGKICHFTITNTTDEKLHSIWIKIWSKNAPLLKDYVKIESEKLDDFYSFKFSNKYPKFNYLASIIYAIDGNNTYCYYLLFTTLNSQQPIDFKITVDKDVFKDTNKGMNINLKYLSHSLDPPDIQLTKNDFKIGSKVPEPFTLKAIYYYFNK